MKLPKPTIFIFRHFAQDSVTNGTSPGSGQSSHVIDDAALPPGVRSDEAPGACGVYGE